MRTSQVSSEFEKGNRSYLRLSLGEFFERRSEALGCLGNTDDEVKRVRKYAFLWHFIYLISSQTQDLNPWHFKSD